MSGISEKLVKYFEQQSEIYPDELYLASESSQEQQNGEVNQSESVWESLRKEIRLCEKCDLYKQCNQKVPGYGQKNTDLMLIGEAPGREEDKQGKPFVGKSGQLLTKILNAIELDRESVFISNIVKCRPPNNRNPHKDEEGKCLDWLEMEIDLVEPKIIVTLGLTAINALMDDKKRLKDWREEDYQYKNSIVIPTYHPSALLQNQNYKRPTWEDFKKVRKRLEEV